MKHGTFVEAFGQFSRQIAFLSKAIGHDDLRPMLHHILIEVSEEDGTFRGVTADGRRLHILDPLSCPQDIGIEAGMWRFLRNTPKTSWIAKIIPNAEVAISFPNYKKVIPAGTPNFETNYLTDFGGNLKGETLTAAVKFINTFPAPTVINPSYLADLGKEYWRVSWYEQNKAVMFRSGSYKAVIMPLKFDD
jgi:hypothetical protein